VVILVLLIALFSHVITSCSFVVFTLSNSCIRSQTGNTLQEACVLREVLALRRGIVF
jgi:hypothetical protein